ncbi:hypothetical protein PENTCL1PPCAC_25423, partial [Pristionchus entomophagus]
SAPATPLGMGTAPPPTMMYPHAPPATPMQPTYQHHGYASGSSTPIHRNVYSPARSKAVIGMDNTAAWLAQQHPQLGAPGTPGHGSRAPSVMSTMTGFNDDAISVMSIGSNIVELQPTTSHQTENIDPARTASAIEEARTLALRMTQQPEHAVRTASELARLLNTANPERFPKDVLDWLIAVTVDALCSIHALQLDLKRAYDIMGSLFWALHSLTSISYQMRESFFVIAHGRGRINQVLNIISQALKIEDPTGSGVFRRSLVFLNLLVREEHRSQYSKEITKMLSKDDHLFSVMFIQMSNKQLATIVEFVCRMLGFGDRRKFREKINESKIRFLLTGTQTHEGVLNRFIRKNDSSTTHNTLRIIELLVRNDPKQTPHEVNIQKWFIEQNVFGLLYKCICMNDYKVMHTSLQIFATLVGSQHITEDGAKWIAVLLTTQLCPRKDEMMKSMQIRNSIIHTLYILSKMRIAVRRLLVDTDGFNYACHIVQNFATKECIAVAGKFDLLESSLVFLLLQLKLDFTAEQSAQLWTERGEKTQLTSRFFDPSFVSCLLNILVCESTDYMLKTRSVQVMADGIGLSPDRFAPLLVSAIDGFKGENVIAALFNAISTAMRTCTNSSLAFIRSSFDLLGHLIEDPGLIGCLSDLARSSIHQFPLNILFSTSFENDEIMIKKVLLVCGKLAADPELQQAWAQHRDRFSKLELSGNYKIAQLAAHILGMIGIEGENDFSMSYANAFL